MNTKKSFSIVIIVIGVAMLLFSNYIARQVALGREQIEQGQRTVDTTESIFSFTPYTKSVGNQFTRSGKEKIKAGTAEADKYETVSKRLQIGGIVIIAIGAFLFFYSRKRKG